MIGDAVNLASRLEGLTKHYGVRMILSESVRAATTGRNPFYYRTLDLVRVKGKKEPVEVLELMGIEGPHSDWLVTFEKGVKACRARF